MTLTPGLCGLISPVGAAKFKWLGLILSRNRDGILACQSYSGNVIAPILIFRPARYKNALLLIRAAMLPAVPNTDSGYFTIRRQGLAQGAS